jgi:cobalamin biosynthesis protein CobW
MRARIPATIITGFLGVGKTTLVRHLLQNAGGRRIAVIVNEFGSLGIDGAVLEGCGIEGCDEDSIVELSNGCLCCTVADEFLPAMEALMDRPNPPEHIVIETSGLALPKPLLKAFSWPAIRSRLTVDAVITVVDGLAVAAGRFADDPEEVARQIAADPSLDHDNPIAEVYHDQLNAADLVLLNKTDLLDEVELARVLGEIGGALPRAVKVVPTREGRVDIAVLLGLAAQAEDDLGSRPSHHDALDGEHEHDDWESFVVAIEEQTAPEPFVARLRAAAQAHDLLRMKGFARVEGKPLRLVVQGVGSRFRHEYDRAWRPEEVEGGSIVVIGRNGIDRAAIEQAILG